MIYDAVKPKLISASAVITTAGKTGLLYAITLLSGTTDSKITIKDGGASGTVIWELSLNGTTAAGETTESIAFNYPIIGVTDLYAVLAGTDAVAYVAYKEIE